jgi:hypothetical protein
MRYPALAEQVGKWRVHEGMRVREATPLREYAGCNGRSFPEVRNSNHSQSNISSTIAGAARHFALQAIVVAGVRVEQHRARNR